MTQKHHEQVGNINVARDVTENKKTITMNTQKTIHVQYAITEEK